MKALRIIWIFTVLLAGCSLIPAEDTQPQSLLTPYVTLTPLIQPEVTQTVAEVPTPAPTPSPTPFVHTLTSNETISSLALTYGLEVNDILAINPQITPKALSVGTEILIPYIKNTSSEESAIDSVISAPLALELTEPDCTPTAEGGLWCVVEVTNPLEQSAAGVTVTFTLKNSAAETVAEQTVPALLNLFAPGEKLPVVVYFAPDVPVTFTVGVSLKTALPVDEANPGYAPLEIKVNSIDPKGRTARVSALIPVQDEASGVDSVWVALIAYDEAGGIVGVRRMEYSPVTEGEEGQAVMIYVYSNSEDIQEVDVLAEVVINEQ
jgi:LysM repeat protein